MQSGPPFEGRAHMTTLAQIGIQRQPGVNPVWLAKNCVANENIIAEILNNMKVSLKF